MQYLIQVFRLVEVKISLFIWKLGRIVLTTFFFATYLNALSIDIQSGKEKSSTYSTIHLQNEKAFICEPKIDEFKVIIEISCYFNNAPIHTFSPVSNPFFTLKSHETNNLYIITIKPKYKMALIFLPENLALNSRITHKKRRLALHWLVVGYKENLPLIESKKVPVEGINFPVDFYKDTLPSVGALGLNGHPINTDEISDVSDYMEVRRYYDRAQYDQVFNIIDKALTKDPNSIFKSEFLLYKIRSKVALDELSDAIDLSKEFLREFSNNEAVPEVLLHLAESSSSVGLLIDSEYFYDRLLEEHYDSKQATKGLISLASHTLSKGDSKKALKYFIQGLEKAETKDLASDAAFKIANFYLAKGNVVEAAKYIQKIAVGNVEYLLKDYQRTYDIAKEFSDHEAYNEAADLMFEILNTLEKDDRKYEGILYQISVWYDLGGRNEKAFNLYQQYKKQFNFGDYLSEVEERMDKVLFEIGDTNTTKQLALYDTISQKYSREEIANRSKYLKAELLLKEKSFQKVLSMEDTLNALDTQLYPNAKSFISKSAKALASAELENKACDKAITLLRRYDFNITQEYSDLLYGCTMDVHDYKEAQSIAKPYIYDKQMKERLKWLYRYVKSSSKVGDIKTVFVMGDDLLSLASVEDSLKYHDVKIDIFNAALALGKEDKAIEMIISIQKEFGLRFSEIELYYKMVKLGKKRHDNTMIENYALKVLSLQKTANSYTFTPQVELLLLSALKKLNKDDEAYKQAKALVTRVSNDKDKARAYYELGMICQRLNFLDQMKKAFTKSSKASKTSPWSQLSQDALDLL